MPVGTARAQRRQRGSGAAKTARQSAQTRPRPQPWQTAHRLGRRSASTARWVGHRRSTGASQASAQYTAAPWRRSIAARGEASTASPRAPRSAGCAAHDAPPWLHGEIARRLVERLAPMRATPDRIVEWWPGPGGGDELLRAAYPRATRVAVEPDAAWAARWRAAARRPWWSRGAAAAAVVEESARDDEIGRAQLVWANMALAFVVDPPALFARWHALLEVEGLALFSCPGPGTLRELREVYAECGWPAPTPGYVDMHDLGDMLVAAGFADPVLDQETLTLRWSRRREAARRAAPARRQHRARALRRPAHAGLAQAAGRCARGARRRRRQHRPQHRDRLRPRLQAGAAPRRRRAGGGLARRDACHGAPAAFVALRRYAKIICSVGAARPDKTAVAVGRGNGASTGLSGDDSRCQLSVLALSTGSPRTARRCASPAAMPKTARCSGCCVAIAR